MHVYRFFAGILPQDFQNSKTKGMYFKYIGMFFQVNLEFHIKSKESKERMFAYPVWEKTLKN